MTVEDYDLPALDGEVDDRPDPASQLARIAARRDESAAAEYLDLAIPTWNGDLVARYRVLERRSAQKLRQAVANSKGADLDVANVDFLIRACDSIRMRDDDGDLVPVIVDGEPVRFDLQLARLLGLEATSARQVVGYLFRDNWIAIGAQSAKVAEWMADTSAAIDGAIRGNS